MVVLRLQNSARPNSHQHDGSDFEEAGRKQDPGGYTGGIQGRKKATMCGSDANAEDRDWFVNQSLPFEESSGASRVAKRYCSGIP